MKIVKRANLYDLTEEQIYAIKYGLALVLYDGGMHRPAPLFRPDCGNVVQDLFDKLASYPTYGDYNLPAVIKNGW